MILCLGKHINNMLPKLCSGCFAVRSVKPYVCLSTEVESGLLLLFPLYNVMWHNILR
jgi:hypothetical protein